jgi:hypothetical protein
MTGVGSGESTLRVHCTKEKRKRRDSAYSSDLTSQIKAHQLEIAEN